MVFLRCRYVLLVIFASLSSSESKKSKPIIASLSAKWKATPLAMEASEFMADESNELFWQFLSDFPVSDEANQRTFYDWTVEEVKYYLKVSDDSPKIKLLKFALALRIYSPRIEMFNQLALDAPAPTCDEFFEVRGLVTCSWAEMREAVEKGTSSPPVLYEKDHIYPGSKASFDKTVIMYANFMAPNMPDLHTKLKEMAERHEIQYVLRHWIRARPDGGVRLSGYGVELALKKTEYKAVDDSELKDDSGKAVSDVDQDEEIEGFDFALLRKLNPDLSSELTTFRNHLQESTNEMRPMKAWQLQDLSFQAAARVLSSPKNEQLQVLKDISQNFPLRARSLTKQQVPDEVRKEIEKNQRHSFSNGQLEGDHALLINGIPIDLETTDIYTIFDILRSESRIMDGLKYFNVPESSMKPFQHLDIKAKTEENYLDIRDPAVVWLNDIESDQKYRQWPTNLHELLRPAFPGTLRRLRKNWCHLVFVIDPTTPEMAQLITTAEALWANDIPIRIGIVFVVNDDKEVDGRKDVGVGLVRAYNFAKSEVSTDQAFTFLAGIYKSLGEDELLTTEHIIERMNKKFPSEDLELILGEKSDWDDDRKLGKSFHENSGLSGNVNVLMNGELFSETELTEDNFEDAVIEKVFEATRHLQRALYMGEVDGGKKLIDFFMERPEVVPRFNDVILKDEPKFIDFQAESGSEAELWDSVEFKEFSNAKKTVTIANFLKKLYISKSDSSNIRPVTMWVVADVETKYGRQLVQNAFKHVKSSGLSRVGIIHNPSSEKTKEGLFIKAVEATLVTQNNNNARNFISKITKEENAELLESGAKKLSDFYVGGMDEERFEKTFQQSPKVLLPHIEAHSTFAGDVLELGKGKSAVVANGRVIVLNPKFEFLAADFKLLESVIYSSTAQKIKETLESEELTSDVAEAGDLIMKLTSLLATQPPLESERQTLNIAGAEHSVITLESRDEDLPEFEIVAVLDPATEAAQEIVPLIMVLYDVINAKVSVYMNCKEKLSDMPVKRFYRYVLDSEPKFKMSNFLYDGPLAKFSDMPSNALLTMTIFPPEGWMVAPVKAVYDLDNIKLEEVSSASVTAEYKLEHLLVEGHASDVMTGSRPGGLQFTLGTKSNPLLVDTIVMANLGYFQLKANPGAWFLRLREGKSQDIYDITGHMRTDSQPGSNNITVLMDSFKSRVIIVKVSKKPEKLDEDLLDDDKSEGKKEESTGIWDSIANTLTGGSPSETASDVESTGDVLNIFTLASGHLYERLMRIMIVSVLRTTKAKVKFWILKNYLSPHFKDFIPKMAAKYGFEYELVQYKWPTWLNQQKEKQRTMWGYKILFLDVLFPLGVDKIIFVDADQIVRADLRELRDLNLEGNPYGYTPFCDDRTEMDGFRFWKSGYWKQHLAGRKYHISAIYVVDLKKFRRIAAGDRLRGQYQGLSQDPNSLSNLDQDLPNNMIHQVGIKSLPQEWLWCETWCSDASKSAAKTIDLCNNPQTKESKLTAAVRIVPEWTEYDNEIKALQKDLENQTGDAKEEAQKDKNKEVKHTVDEL